MDTVFNAAGTKNVELKPPTLAKPSVASAQTTGFRQS
jgi:hypothetical protein